MGLVALVELEPKIWPHGITTKMNPINRSKMIHFAVPGEMRISSKNTMTIQVQGFLYQGWGSLLSTEMHAGSYV